ncbi:MAG TPA: hypothetical protein VGI74_20655 [Streptosporangiaceae bacterium]|jgi:hypothetical protein
MSAGRPSPAKPTVEELGIDVEALEWQRSDGGTGSVEIAFVGVKPVRDLGHGGPAPAGPAPSDTAQGGGEWVLLRVADDPARRVLVYDRFEWECFLDGVKNGEFDDAQ